MDQKIRLGILSALQEEQAGIHLHMEGVKTEKVGNKHYTYGSLWGLECISALSGIGKAAAASTTAILAERFKVSHVLLTGVAGSARSEIKIGDLVIGMESIQHDLDARPLFPRFEVPSVGISRFKSNQALMQDLAKACRRFLDRDYSSAIPLEDRTHFALDRPQIYTGLIGTGDLFVNSSEKLASIKEALPELLAVEMEGAAVAQVCQEFGIPFATMRTISDKADEQSAIDFNRFIQRVASVYAIHIIRHLCQNGLSRHAG